MPFRTNRDKESFEAKKKAERLRKYTDLGARLISFVPDFESDKEGPGREQSLFDGLGPIAADEAISVPVGEVLKWVEGEPAYAEKQFFA